MITVIVGKCRQHKTVPHSLVFLALFSAKPKQRLLRERLTLIGSDMLLTMPMTYPTALMAVTVCSFAICFRGGSYPLSPWLTVRIGVFQHRPLW